MSPGLDNSVAMTVPSPILDFKPPSTVVPSETSEVKVCLNKRKRKEWEEKVQNKVDGSSESSSSSIGKGSALDGEGGDEEGEVQSRLKEGPLDCLDSLEDTLPIKKGLSNYFSRKLKSFTSLFDAVTSKDIEKPEKPINKRRRLLMAHKVSLSKRASYESRYGPFKNALM
ncbi:hypothetical protein QJS10_CPA01g01897 [Acorus calamus]|uniref:Uncharacterized protein n=1 Tax=Acorus calamus TaxID=4465 RepID=A0AAV9FFN6_ACOCL|nr:hypothetical protein QJS10_CPA01g01897 [Acorus calamus]